MVGFFSNLNHKKFLIVLSICFCILLLLHYKDFKDDKCEIISIKSPLNKDETIDGIIHKESMKIYQLNEQSFQAISYYDLSDTKNIKKNIPELTEIGKIYSVDLNQKEVNSRDWGNFRHWSRTSLKEYFLGIFIILLFIYCITYGPNYIRAWRDKRNNNSMVPFSYKEEEEKEKILNFTCSVCMSKKMPKIIKEEFIESMQFIYTECVDCQSKNKERLK